MNLKEKIAALSDEAKTLRTKAADTPGEFTEADADRAQQIAKEHGELMERLHKQDAATKALGGLADVPSDDEQQSTDDTSTAKSLGEAFVKSEAYQGFVKEHPKGVSRETPISIKATGVGGRTLTKAATINTDSYGGPVKTEQVDDLVHRPAPRLLDLITRGTTDLSFFEYRQVVSKTNNAAVVGEAKDNAGTGTSGGVKPLSTLTTQAAESKSSTYADGMEVTNQELADDGIMQSLIDSTLTENLDIRLEDVLLNGAGTAEEPAGLFNTTGVLNQAFATDMPTSIRKAITKLRTTSGANIQGVLLNPEDDEAWDLLKNANGDYLGRGPFGSGPATAWGHRRIGSQAIPVGQAVIGDFSTIHLLIHEALSIMAFNQHKDYAQRNLSYIRAELRAHQLFRNPAKLCIVDLTSA